jgi:hypothetical protein
VFRLGVAIFDTLCIKINGPHRDLDTALRRDIRGTVGESGVRQAAE